MMDLRTAATLPGETVLAELGSGRKGLSGPAAAEALAAVGPNALRSHGARPLSVLARQLRNPLLLLLGAAAAVSIFVGEGIDAAIIFGIVGLSVGLGFFNEYRSERAVEALHSRLRHFAVVVRDDRPQRIDVTELVPGDLVRLAVGDVVPADMRLIEANGLECDEAVLTGESLPAEKRSDPVPAGDDESPLASCALMGTVVREGEGLGVVTGTGGATEFGKIALQLGERQPQTAFQLGLRDFSMLLVRVTMVMAGLIFVVNVAIGRPLIDATLFALAIAVGLTPQLLPAIVTVSLATGARRLAQKSVVVKRLVSIEDLGNIEVFFTDKTGTLTDGDITFAAAIGATGRPSDEVLRAGLACNGAVFEGGVPVSGNQLDCALWQASGAAGLGPASFPKLAELPFDYQRRVTSVLVDDPAAGRTIVVKGAPESILERCTAAPPEAQAVLDRLFDAGSRVVAVATRPAPGAVALTPADEDQLKLIGFISFNDRPKADAAAALELLARLEVEVKIITGDNGRVARKVCGDIGLESRGMLTGQELDEMDDEALQAALPATTIFARVTPEQKSRVIKEQRAQGKTVGFLGDGVNDAVAIHDADVGVSVETATDVAKDAADIVLLEKDLGVLATGVVEGRRIFANTIKYVLMGTSSNFGNMFSAGAASMFLSFLPMLPTQILLNNLLYDTSEMTIPTDNVDADQLVRPAHWDTALIRRFMMFFGPISSIFDFITFGVMLWVFDAGPTLFRTGWFVESLATQSLVIFAIRTRHVPFFRSRPSKPLIISTLTVVTIGVLLPFMPFSSALGFTPLPVAFLGVLAVMVVAYLALIELGKLVFYRPRKPGPSIAREIVAREHRVRHRATRWSVP